LQTKVIAEEDPTTKDLLLFFTSQDLNIKNMYEKRKANESLATRMRIRF